MDICTGESPSACEGGDNAGLQTFLRRLPLLKIIISLFTIVLMLAARLAAAADADAVRSNATSVTTASNANLSASFILKKGFRLELAASEPMVTAPVAMAFDENGRLFVVEMRGADRRGAHLGRVRMLDNMNDEGVFQNSTIYADNLAWPSAVACYAGGIFVADAPDIIYFKDIKGDGVADARQVVMSGFGGTNVLEPNLLPNNFNWGLDNLIHGASGGIGGEISSQGTRRGAVSIDHRDFSFDPRTLEVFAESGPAESGLSFDSHGCKLVSDFIRPLMTPMYEARYTARNEYYPKPAELAVVADPSAPIYRFVAPTNSGATARQPSNGLVPGWFTSARGCLVYRGFAFPTNYFDNVFIADSGAHIIHRLILQENGLELVVQRAADELNSEFLISKDPSFRPVQMVNGPDGALYIADMQDGNERGRIYRVLPEKFKRAKPPQLGKFKTYELVSTLAQGAGWHRDTAARLLYERNDPAAPALLRATLNRARLPQARVLALHALAGDFALTEDDVLRAMRDPDERVRENGVQVSETLFKGGDASGAILSQFRALVADPSPRVRTQLAFTLGDLERADQALALGQVLSRNLYDPWTQNAVLSSAVNNSGNLFSVLAGDAGFRNDPMGFAFLRRLTTMIGVSGRQNSVTQAGGFIGRGMMASVQAYALLFNLGDGLYRTRSSLALVDTQGTLQPFYSSALDLAADPTKSEAARTAATQLIGVSTLSVGSVGDWLLLVCSPPTGPTLQTAAVDALTRYDDPQVVNGFLQMWPILAPVARSHAISALMSRDSHVANVLVAVQTGRIAASDLSSSQKNFLRTDSNPAIRQRAVELLGPVPVTRPAITERFKSALTLRGAPERGAAIFRLRCAECHVLSGRDSSLGPELLRARNYTKDLLLSRILEPNLAVRSDYTTQVVESKEGQSLVGIITDENAATVTLMQVGGEKIVWPQLNIRSIHPQSWSLMPDGLEQGMGPQEMADLIEYIQKGMK